MFVCQLINGQRKNFQIVEGEKIIDLNHRLIKEYNVEIFRDDTSPFIISNNKEIVNCPSLRHEFVKDHCDFDQVFYILFIPDDVTNSRFAAVRGNLRTDSFIPEMKTCAICFEELKVMVNFKLIFCVEPCQHRFHRSCIDGGKISACPMCRGFIANISFN